MSVLSYVDSKIANSSLEIEISGVATDIVFGVEWAGGGATVDTISWSEFVDIAFDE